MNRRLAIICGAVMGTLAIVLAVCGGTGFLSQDRQFFYHKDNILMNTTAALAIQDDYPDTRITQLDVFPPGQVQVSYKFWSGTEADFGLPCEKTSLFNRDMPLLLAAFVLGVGSIGMLGVWAEKVRKVVWVHGLVQRG